MPGASAGSDASSNVQHTRSQDAKAQTVANLKRAVASIPAYIERTTLLLILVPVCMHVDRQDTCNLSTWRRRGWTRLELQAAMLTCGEVRIMVCPGAEAVPYFFWPLDAYSILCGSADYTCCQREHFMNGQGEGCARTRKFLLRM